MSRSAQNNAQNTYNQSQALTNASEANSDSLYNQLDPTFTQMATNPTGMSQTELSDANTAASQSAGGALGADAGAANQDAAANRNSGSFAPALDQASHDSEQTLSNDALGVQNANTGLKEQQQTEGLQGLQSLDNQQNSDVLSSLGLQDTSNNSLITAGQSGWLQNMDGTISALKGAGATSSSGASFAV